MQRYWRSSYFIPGVAASAIAILVTFGCTSERGYVAPADSSAVARLDSRASFSLGKAQYGAAANADKSFSKDAAARPSLPAPMEAPPAPEGEQGAPGQAPTLRAQDVVPGSMLVRVGDASIEVDSIDAGVERVRAVARRTGATIANTSRSGGREQIRTASIELRIPSERFEEAVSGLSPIGKLESVNVSVEDVSEEYVDGTARVANARRLEQRLIELLAQRTGKLSDVLSVERELARVRESIERYEGRLRYLRTRASVSTLTVNVHEPLPIVATRPGESPMRDAFVQAWRNLVRVTATVIASLGVLIPVGVLAFAVILASRRLLAGRLLALPGTKSSEAGPA
jgi:Domain of unknown function (DUF4349)